MQSFYGARRCGSNIAARLDIAANQAGFGSKGQSNDCLLSAILPRSLADE
jgi:hypothetical protein